MDVDAREWRFAALGTDERREQAKALRRCGSLTGRTRAQVLRALGRASEDTGDELSYLLGPEEGGLPLDSAYLDVIFDPRGRVRSVSLDGVR